jgi:hypothetical protein
MVDLKQSILISFYYWYPTIMRDFILSNVCITLCKDNEQDPHLNPVS